MRKLLLTAAAAFAVALSFNAAVAADLTDDNNWPTETAEPANTVFDLGVDVTGYADSRSDAMRFLAAQSAQTRGILINTCEHYMDTPNSTKASETLEFCSYVVGG